MRITMEVICKIHKMKRTKLVLLEDDPVGYDILYEISLDDNEFFDIDLELSKTVLGGADDLIQKQIKGYVPTLERDVNSYIRFEEIHEALASPMAPTSLVMVLDMKLFEGDGLAVYFGEKHGITHLDYLMVGGASLAIQAIQNPVIRELYIYIASSHVETTDVQSELNFRIEKCGHGGRFIYDKNERRIWNNRKKAEKIMQIIQEEWVLAFDRTVSDVLVAGLWPRTSVDNHNWGKSTRPIQLESIDSILRFSAADTDGHFKLKMGEIYDEKHPMGECLKSFCCGSNAGLPLFGILIVALAASQFKQDKSTSSLIIETMNKINDQMHIGTDEELASEGLDWSEFIRYSSFLPDQNQKSFTKSINALFELFSQVLFQSKEGKHSGNLLEINFGMNSLKFVLKIGKKLVENLNTTTSTLAEQGTLEREHDGTTKIIDFWVLSQVTSSKVGNSRKWGPNGRLNLEFNGVTSELTFYV